ncbi:MAG: hypothetical protein PHV48_01320 [Candidatus Omnitrophica bacterium]|nr:hypothetical protein [Candidatus Omnitrophota bacterium]
MNIKDMIPAKVKAGLKTNLQSILTRSIRCALKEQGLEKMASRLEEIIPDISKQYSLFEVKGSYLNAKVRGMHAFQMSLIDKVIRNFNDSIVIVDIGDSAGTHMQYIRGLYSKGLKIRSLSVNLDEKAVVKIRSKGLEAICAKAENLENYNINPDIFLCFETLEHLMDPCKFLNSLSSNTKVKYLIATVPYLANSRIGLHHIRQCDRRDVYAENTHIFELSPDDWKLLIRHSGWRVENEQVYLQYPMRGLWRATRSLWRKNDFEGFYGFVLSRDSDWSSKYKDW